MKRLIQLTIVLISGFAFLTPYILLADESENGNNEIQETSNDTVWIGDFYLVITDEKISVERKRTTPEEIPDKDKPERRKEAFEKINQVETVWFKNLDFGIAAFTYDEGFNLPDEYLAFEQNMGWSRHLRFYIFQSRINLIRQKLNIVPGLALDYKRYSLSRPVTMISGGDSLIVETNQDANYNRNRYINTHLQLPLYLYYRSNPFNRSNSFNIMAGGHIGYLFRNRINQEIDNTRFRDKGFFNENRFSYGVGLRLGYGRFNIYANYDLMPVFQENRGPAFHAFTAGIVFSGVR